MDGYSCVQGAVELVALSATENGMGYAGDDALDVVFEEHCIGRGLVRQGSQVVMLVLYVLEKVVET